MKHYYEMNGIRARSIVPQPHTGTHDQTPKSAKMKNEKCARARLNKLRNLLNDVKSCSVKEYVVQGVDKEIRKLTRANE